MSRSFGCAPVSNTPGGPGRRHHESFGDPVVATALLDRLLYHAVVVQIEGSSYRLREHAALVPENLRSRQIVPPDAEQPRRRGRPTKETIRDVPYLGGTMHYAVVTGWGQELDIRCPLHLRESAGLSAGERAAISRRPASADRFDDSPEAPTFVDEPGRDDTAVERQGSISGAAAG